MVYPHVVLNKSSPVKLKIAIYEAVFEHDNVHSKETCVKMNFEK